MGAAATALLPRDPAAAEQIFRASASETARGMAESAAVQWLLQDSAAARAWIGKTPLFSDETREQLLKIELPAFTR